MTSTSLSDARLLSLQGAMSNTTIVGEDDVGASTAASVDDGVAAGQNAIIIVMDDATGQTQEIDAATMQQLICEWRAADSEIAPNQRQTRQTRELRLTNGRRDRCGEQETSLM